MAKLNIKCIGGATVVNVDGVVVTGLKQFNINMQGDNNGKDSCTLSLAGVKSGVNLGSLVSAECEAEIIITGAFAALLKEQ